MVSFADLKGNYVERDVAHLAHRLSSNDHKIQLEALRCAIGILWGDVVPSIYLSDAQLQGALVACLSSTQPSIQLESACTLLKIFSIVSKASVVVVDPIKMQSINDSCIDGARTIVQILSAQSSDELRETAERLGLLDLLVSLVDPDTDITMLREVTRALRSVTSCESFIDGKSLPINKKIEICKAFCNLIDANDVDVLVDALWSLPDIMGRNDEIERIVIGSDVFPKILTLLGMSEDERIQHAALNFIGKVTVSNRETPSTLSSSSLSKISNVLRPFTQPGTSLKTLEYVVFILKNLSLVHDDVVDDLMPSLYSLIRFEDPNILKTALSVLMKITKNRVKESLDYSSIVPRLIDLLGHKSPKVRLISICILSSITTRNESYKQIVLSNGILRHLPSLIEDPVSNTRNVALLMLFFVTCSCDSGLVQEVLDSGIIPVIVRCLKQGEERVQSRTVSVVCNLVECATKPQLAYLVGQGVFPHLLKLTKSSDSKTSMMALHCVRFLSPEV